MNTHGIFHRLAPCEQPWSRPVELIPWHAPWHISRAHGLPRDGPWTNRWPWDGSWHRANTTMGSSVDDAMASCAYDIVHGRRQLMYTTRHRCTCTRPNMPTHARTRKKWLYHSCNKGEKRHEMSGVSWLTISQQQTEQKAKSRKMNLLGLDRPTQQARAREHSSMSMSTRARIRAREHSSTSPRWPGNPCEKPVGHVF